MRSPELAFLSPQNRRRILIALLLLGCALLGLAQAERTGLLKQTPAYVPLFTARSGGAFVVVGARLRELVNNDKSSRIALIEIPSAGSTENLKSMAKYQNAISFTFVRVPELLRYGADFKSVRAISLINRDIVQVVASKASQIQRLEQLGEMKDGKCRYQVYVGMTDSGTLETAKALLEQPFPRCFEQWQRYSEKLEYDATATELLNGLQPSEGASAPERPRLPALDAAVFSTGRGSDAIEKLFKKTERSDGTAFNFIPLSDHERKMLMDRGYEDAPDAELYGTKLNTVSARVLIATNERTDDWVVRELIDALDRNREKLEGSLTKVRQGDSSPLVTDPGKFSELVKDLQLHEAASSKSWWTLKRSAWLSLGGVLLLALLQLSFVPPATMARDQAQVPRVPPQPVLTENKSPAPHRVFLSYGSADLQYVQSVLVPHLQKHDITVWWSAMIPAGVNFHDAIASALDSAVWVLVVLSPDTPKSRWVKFETEDAIAAGKGVLPVIVRQPCVLRDAHIGFRTIQHIDLTKNEESGLARVVGRLREVPPAPLSAPTGQAPFSA